jgi:serine/threonine protein kinase
MALAVRAKLAQEFGRVHNMGMAFHTHSQHVQYKTNLVQICHATIWKYFFVRLRLQLPEEDPTITPGAHPAMVDDYQVGEAIGKGRFATVSMAKDLNQGKTEQSYAVKTIAKSTVRSSQDLRRLEHHIRVWQLWSGEYSHPNIVALREVIMSRTHIFCVMDYSGSENLEQRLQRCEAEDEASALSLRSSRSIVMQLFSAIAYMHLSRRVAHLDIKPSNIMVDFPKGDLQIQLIDFDMSKLGGSLCQFARGTFPYQAPEMLCQSSYLPYPVDVWSAGLVILDVCCLVSFIDRTVLKSQEGSEEAKMNVICQAFEAPGSASELLRAHARSEMQDALEEMTVMVDGMLQVDASQRWTAQHLQERVDDSI